MQVRRIAALVAIPAVATAALSACGNGDKGSGSGGMVSIGIAEPKHLAPTGVNDSSGGQVVDALFAGLLQVNPEDNKIVEEAAESVTSTDSKTWTIKLKDGYTFHNGDKVTSQDYIDSWNYGAYAPNGQDNNSFFERIEGYAALNPADANATPTAKEMTGLAKVSDTEFTVTLSKPFADWKSVLSYNAFYPMPKVAFADMKAYEEAPIGNGPFKMTGTWQHDKSIKVEAYADYQGVKPKIAGVEFRIYQQPSAQYADLQADNVDIMTAIPTESLGSAKSDLGERYQTSPNSTFTFVALPSYNSKFANPEVRKAISMAIDREEIAKTIFKGTRTAADSFVSPVVPGYRKGGGGEAVTFNPTKAKQMLDAAGGFPGGTVTITYNQDGGHKEWVDAVCNQLTKNLSVQCLSAPEPKFSDLTKKAKSKQDIGAFRMGWSMDYASMENYLDPLYSAKGSSNYYGYDNPTFDAAVAAGDQEPTTEGAIKKYHEAEDILARDVPVVPLFFGQNIFGFSTKVTDVFVDARSRVDLLRIDTK